MRESFTWWTARNHSSKFTSPRWKFFELTGQPRLAVINRTKAEDHLAEWRRRLGLHFNAVREFDADQASFSNRVELLETLAGIEQRWKPQLMSAVAIFREEWENVWTIARRSWSNFCRTRSIIVRRPRDPNSLRGEKKSGKAQAAVHGRREPA